MSKSTIYSQACQEISGFQTMGEEFRTLEYFLKKATSY
jgi:hypothetical protein